MLNTETEMDVLIVGAGPVGLFLANECSRRGLRWQLIEERPSQSEHSKALSIFPRTLEIFDMAGLVAPFLEAANRVTSVEVRAHERTLARMRFAPEESPYPFVAMVPQDVTEKLLVEQLRRKGGGVEYETSFVSAEQENDGVSITVNHKGEMAKLRASFVVGCDGAHSAVRHLQNIPFEGAEYDETFLLADVETNEILPADELQLCPSELGPVAIFPMSATRRRIVATIERPEGDAPSLDLVQKIVDQRGPVGVEVRALLWGSYFHVHHRIVTRLRTERIFIAGDAAHIHSPFGGQGMNTGLHDVWNLVWKLDLFLHGRGNEPLLDSYGAERLPVIRNVIEMTDLMTKVMGTPNRFAQALRDTIIPMVSHLAPFQHAFVQRLSELGIAYPGSPIVEGPGRRYWDDSMRGGKGILRRFLLFVGGDSEVSTIEAAKQLCESFSDVAEFRSSPISGIALVRPDGYVAYSARRRESVAALGSVRLLLERQTGQRGLTTSAPSIQVSKISEGGTFMEPRINFLKVARGAYEAMLGLEKYIDQCGLDDSLLDLVRLRASQINGCAFCIDMHWKDLRSLGENEQRLYGLDGWRESPYYTDRERAALAWTEAVTNVREDHVPDVVYEEVRSQFTEKELADLTVAIASINVWNRLNIAARTVPGTYQPAKMHELKHELKRGA